RKRRKEKYTTTLHEDDFPVYEKSDAPTQFRLDKTDSSPASSVNTSSTYDKAW
ncbi:unnamed protein product, partial [Amoebophrya sp. A25]